MVREKVKEMVRKGWMKRMFPKKESKDVFQSMFMYAFLQKLFGLKSSQQMSSSQGFKQFARVFET